METQIAYPRVSTVEALSEKRLLVTFSNDSRRIYICKPLLAEEVFACLKDNAVFRRVVADPHGYGVVWNDETDLAESELWTNGTPVD